MQKIIIGILLLWVTEVRSQGGFTAFEYYFGNDPGLGSGTQITGFPTATGEVNFVKDITIPSNMAPGFHTMSIRGKQSVAGSTMKNRWSVSNTIHFFVFPPSMGTVNSSGINRLEYFFGADPGFGQGNQVVIGSSQNVSLQLSMPSGLSPGFYQMAYRVRTNQGQWSVTKSVPFVAWSGSVNPNGFPVVALEWYYDTDPGLGQGNPVAFSPNPSAHILKDINLDLSSLTVGTHVLYVRAMDTSGLWSSPYPSIIHVSCDEGVKLFSRQSGNWNVISTWACGRVPTITDDVFVKSPHKIILEPGNLATGFSIETEYGSVVEIKNGSVFKVK